MTQHQLIIEYLKEFNRIKPAKLGGTIYLGHMFGSDTPKRCRELRKKGILDSIREGRFEVFFLVYKPVDKSVDKPPYSVDNLLKTL